MNIVNISSPTSASRLQGIEIARGIAALMVVFYHSARHIKNNIGYLPFSGITQFGHAGVDFFFVLSGFLIFYVHGKDIDRPTQIIHYFKRRLIRIYPFYWVVTFISLVLIFMFSRGESPSLGDTLLSMSLYPSQSDPIVGVAWTLQYEIVFYVLFATLILSKRIGALVFIIWFLTIVSANFTDYFNGYSNPLIRNLTSAYSIEFFLGMFAALMARTINSKSGILFFVTGASLFLIFGISENIHLFNGYEPPARLYYGFSSVLIVIGLANIQLKESSFYKYLLSIGSASYAIYLTHYIFIGGLYKIMEWTQVFEKSPVILTFALFVTFSVIGGIIFSKMIEYPVMKKLNRLKLKKSFEN